ncbi:MAG TPA: hypothetical protein VF636_11805 [Sphingomonas sp.]|jgi:hypothetical protein
MSVIGGTAPLRARVISVSAIVVISVIMKTVGNRSNASPSVPHNSTVDRPPNINRTNTALTTAFSAMLIPVSMRT